MARLRAYYGIDMTDTASTVAEFEYADEGLVIIGDYVDESYYLGNFSFPDGRWAGTITKAFQYHDGEEIFHVTGLHLNTRYAIVGTTREEAYRKAFSGDDSMIGSRESDKLVGFAGDDRINAGGGADYLGGYTGRDILHGQAGRDRLSGGSGNDTLDGGSGNDRLAGGKDADVFVFNKASGRDQIADFGSRDHIQIESGASRFAQLDITKDGDDVVIAFADTEIRLIDTSLHSIGPSDFLFRALRISHLGRLQTGSADAAPSDGRLAVCGPG